MNKFQPKIADFGCEIVDAISNGLTKLVTVYRKMLYAVYAVYCELESPAVQNTKRASNFQLPPT